MFQFELANVALKYLVDQILDFLDVHGLLPMKAAL
jgi:hypothetical protein